MKLIRDNRLYESILDDIDVTSTQAASKVLSNNIVAQHEDFDILVHFMLLLHSSDQISRLHGNIEKIADTLYDSVSSYRGVTDFSIDVIIPNPEFPENKTKYPHNLLQQENSDELVLAWPVSENSNLSELTHIMESRVTSIPKKGNTAIEFYVWMNFSKKNTLNTLAILTGQLFETMRRMFDQSENMFGHSMSYCLTIDCKNGYTVHNDLKDYAPSYRKCFMMLLDKNSHLSNISRTKSMEFINDYITAQKNKRLSKAVIPEEIRALMTSKDYLYTAQYHPIVEIHGNVVRMKTPDYITVEVFAPYYIWYYVQKYNKKHGTQWTVEVNIEGALSIGDYFFQDSDGDWYKCIKSCKKIISYETEFRLIDLYIMPAIYTDVLMLVNPVLQKTKAYSEEQVTDINQDRWKNPDVNIESTTHEIIIEDVPRFVNKKRIRAIRK